MRACLIFLTLVLSLYAKPNCSFALNEKGIQFSTGGKRILTGGGGGFMVFDAESGERLFQHDFGRQFVFGMSTTINSDGTIVVAGIADSTNSEDHRIEVFDVDQGKQIGVISSPYPGVSFSSDGKWVVGKQGEQATVWSAARLPTLEPVLSLGNALSFPAVSPNSQLVSMPVGTSDRDAESMVNVHVIDLKSEIKTNRIIETSFSKRKVISCFSPDSKHLLVTDRASEIHIFSVVDPKR